MRSGALRDRKICAVRDLEAVAEIRLEVRGHRAAQFHADDAHAAALTQHFLHFPAQIDLFRAERLIVERHIGVARNAENRFFEHIVHLENIVRERQDDVLGHQAAAFVVREKDKRRQGSGRGNQAEALGFLVAEQRRDIQHLALKVGEGVMRVHDLRREHGRYHGFEIALDVFALAAVQLVHGNTVQVLLGEAAVHVAERGVPAHVKRLNGGVDAVELFACGQAGLAVAAVRFERGHVGQTAHHES